MTLAQWRYRNRLTRLEMPIEVRSPCELGRAEVAELGLRERRDVALMGAHLGEATALGAHDGLGNHGMLRGWLGLGQGRLEGAVGMQGRRQGCVDGHRGGLENVQR